MTVNTNGESAEQRQIREEWEREVDEHDAARKRPTVADVTTLARVMTGAVHGDGPDGVVDIEFRELAHAVRFATVAGGNGWTVSLRDAVHSLTDSVVLCVWALPNPDPHIRPIDESEPRNCEVCGTVEWWAQSGSKSTVEGRRQEWHDAKHPRPFEGWKARAARPAGLSRPAAEPVHYTSPSAVIACGAPIFEETVFSPERSGVTCSGCRAAIDAAPERGSAAYNSALLNEWGI